MPSRWWKTDLQVATPAWHFKFPAGSNYRLDQAAERARFADDYMAATKARGVEVLAICDHNSHDWIDEMKAAGERYGVVVFPACEITTGSGADGIHLLIIGDLSKTGRDFDLLLASNLGFDGNTPRFISNGGGKPQPNVSSKTILQILDDLPEGYLVIAPHAFNSNGIAASSTAKGSVRWSALHHPRLAAIDAGDCSNPGSDSFVDRFRRRELTDYPCSKDIAFVSTSDAYALEEIGNRFTWIRMEKPTLEALRQAFLDPDARILCDWNSRLKDFRDENPNNVAHGWIEEVSLGGVLANSSEALTISFHPGLNVLIGGRGSGKSTVVSALRCLYSSTTSLPENTRRESEEFMEKAFRDARIASSHRMAVSQERQHAGWTHSTGSESHGEDQNRFPTSFRVRVISQKELFERVAGDVAKRFSASRSLLGLIDSSLGLAVSESSASGTWSRVFREAQRHWTDTAGRRSQLVVDVAQIPSLKARIKELEGQVAAFASPETKEALARYRYRQQERDELEKQQKLVTEHVAAIERVVSEFPTLSDAPVPATLGAHAEEYAAVVDALQSLVTNYHMDIASASRRVQQALAEWQASLLATEWRKAYETSEQFFKQYTAELSVKGIDAATVAEIERELRETLQQVAAAETKAQELEDVNARLAEAWSKALTSTGDRRNQRAGLFRSVEERSRRLRFELAPYRDTVGWVDRVRELLSLRSDAFVDDVPELADWIWNQSEDIRDARWSLWRESLIEGKFDSIQQQSKVRTAYFQRLAGTDQTIRLRVAVEMPDDVATMRFLRDGTKGDKESDWQAITEGSPGQRTAAMLGLVLHHGNEPLVLDQPEDDLDSEWITSLLVKELRESRWARQIIVASHNANVPVNGDAESVVALENADGALRIRRTTEGRGDEAVTRMHVGPIENESVRRDIQNIMEGGVAAFMRREQRYNNEIRELRE